MWIERGAKSIHRKSTHVRCDEHHQRPAIIMVIMDHKLCFGMFVCSRSISRSCSTNCVRFIDSARNEFIGLRAVNTGHWFGNGSIGGNEMRVFFKDLPKCPTFHGIPKRFPIFNLIENSPHRLCKGLDHSAGHINGIPLNIIRVRIEWNWIELRWENDFKRLQQHNTNSISVDVECVSNIDLCTAHNVAYNSSQLNAKRFICFVNKNLCT